MRLTFPLRSLAALACAGTMSAAPAAHGGDTAPLDRLDLALTAMPRASAQLVHRARRHQRSGAFDAAFRDLGHAARLDPARASIELELARVQLLRGRPAEANDHGESYVASEPLDPVGHFLVAESRLALCDFEGATKALERAIDLGGRARPEALLACVDALIASREDGRVAALDVLAALEPVRAGGGGATAVELRAVQLEVELDRHDDAIVRLRRLAAGARRPEHWLAREAEVLVDAGRTQEALGAWLDARAALAAASPKVRATAAARSLDTRIAEGIEALSQ